MKLKNKLIISSLVVGSGLAIIPPITMISIQNNQNSKVLNIENSRAVTVRPTELAKDRTAYGWTIEDINSSNFIGLPSNENGKIYKVAGVDNFPNEQKIEITYFVVSSFSGSTSVLTVTVEGFRKESLEEKVERIYGDIDITPTLEGAQIPATKENWSLEDVNDNNFNNLLENSEGINVRLDSISFDDSNPLFGSIILTYEFSWYDGIFSVFKDFKVTGFEKLTYNSNLAAQNHYKLVALFRMINVKSGVNKSKINTSVFEDDLNEGKMTNVKKYFTIPAEREYNVVRLIDVVSSADNTLTTYQKGKNMKLGTVKLKFSIFDWVNNNRTYVETNIFDGFENPLNYWSDLFKKTVNLSTPLTNSLFDWKSVYNGFFNSDKSKYPNGSGWNDNGEEILAGADKGYAPYEYIYAWLQPLMDFTNQKKGTNINGGWINKDGAMFRMMGLKPNHEQFINMITKNAKANYIGNGPDKENDLANPIKNGGISEVLRNWIFNNIKNQELYQYDWIAFKNIDESKNSIEWVGPNNSNDMPFGYGSVWLKTSFEYDIWLDYERVTVKFNVKLGLVDKSNGGAKNL